MLYLIEKKRRTAPAADANPANHIRIISYLPTEGSKGMFAIYVPAKVMEDRGWKAGDFVSVGFDRQSSFMQLQLDTCGTGWRLSPDVSGKVTKHFGSLEKCRISVTPQPGVPVLPAPFVVKRYRKIRGGLVVVLPPGIEWQEPLHVVQQAPLSFMDQQGNTSLPEDQLRQDVAVG